MPLNAIADRAAKKPIPRRFLKPDFIYINLNYIAVHRNQASLSIIFRTKEAEMLLSAALPKTKLNLSPYHCCGEGYLFLWTAKV